LLIDAGLSLREMKSRLAAIDVAPESIHGVLLTHEHIDHGRSVSAWAHAYKVPVIGHHQCLGLLPGRRPLATALEIEAGETFSFRELQIEPFSLTHDAAACVGYVVEGGTGKIGFATDLGIATRLVAQRLGGCRVLVLESNHDEELLRDGPYPWHLKQRIRSNHGHLSNTASAQLLEGILWDGLEAVFLAHLSEANNTPEHAISAARQILDGQNRCGPELIVGSQYHVSRVFAPGA
jgi:phosphoribosyl 1,2-cyclic phosphodiesterase